MIVWVVWSLLDDEPVGVFSTEDKAVDASIAYQQELSTSLVDIHRVTLDLYREAEA